MAVTLRANSSRPREDLVVLIQLCVSNRSRGTQGSTARRVGGWCLQSLTKNRKSTGRRKQTTTGLLGFRFFNTHRRSRSCRTTHASRSLGRFLRTKEGSVAVKKATTQRRGSWSRKSGLRVCCFAPFGARGASVSRAQEGLS